MFIKDELQIKDLRLIGIEEKKHFSVVIPFVNKNNNTYVLFEKRASKLTMNPNDYCFPGGKREKGETAEITALRELKEELLLDNKQIVNLNYYASYLSSWNYMIHVFYCYLENYNMTFSKDEVSEVVLVNYNKFLSHNTELEINIDRKCVDLNTLYKIGIDSNYRWSCGKDIFPIYQVNDILGESVLIWGITGAIIKEFIEKEMYEIRSF